MSSNTQRITAGIVGAIIVVTAFLGGMYYGINNTHAVKDTTDGLLNKELGKNPSVDFAPFWRAWNILNEKYVATQGTSTEPVTDQDKVYGAIKGLTEAFGDPYTTFFPPQESKDFAEEIAGNFEGVGMEVGMRDGIITVIAPLKDTPAYKAGIKAGDKILKIDDTITSSITVDEAVKKMRGVRGTAVNLTIISEGDESPREVSIIRDKIDIPTIDTVTRNDGIFVIRLYSFSANSATLFRNALEQFVRSGKSKLIIDLRGNPGGYLEAAIDMASWFLPSDKIIVKEDTGGNGENEEFKSKGYNVFNENLKVIILVDGGSASASEILAGALQEHGIAQLVGTKTYGKGSVQQLVNLTSDTSLKITVARWLTPNGTSISAQGLHPDVEVKVTPEDIEKLDDVQLKKAVELLGGNVNEK
ncbi:S41 family peptidase [Patescibacteria group bacterium]|nr:S41 family peptidase [Patescibacteria group bacterium]